jgi:hypothetical protein
LAGHLVYLWFQRDEASGLEKPHKPSDVPAVDALLNALADYEPRTEQLWVPAGPLPERAPESPLRETSAGARFYALPLVGAAPSSMLFTLAVFELGLAYTTFLTADSVWAESSDWSTATIGPALTYS